MATWIDNLLAVLIAGVVALILFSQQRTAQEMSIDSTVSYASKTQVLDIASWLTEDMTNLGAGVPQNIDVLEIPLQTGDSLTSRFAYRRRLSRDEAAALGTPADTTTAKRFVLQLRPADTVMVKDQTVRLHELVRCQVEVGPCPTNATPVSTSRMTDFFVEVMDARGNPTFVPDNVRLVRFRLASVTPFAESRRSSYLDRTYWGTVLPVMQPSDVVVTAP